MAKSKSQQDDEKPVEQPPIDGATPADETQALLDAFKKEGASTVNPDIFYHKFTLEDGKTPNPICGVVIERRERPPEAVIDPRSNKPMVDDAGKTIYKHAHYYILGITRAIGFLWKIIDGDGDKKEYERVPAQPGMYAWVDERWAVSSLQSYLPVYAERNNIVGPVEVNEVLIVPKKKVAHKGGRSLWKAEVLAKRIPQQQLATVPLLAPKSDTPELPPSLQEEGEAIPF